MYRRFGLGLFTGLILISCDVGSNISEPDASTNRFSTYKARIEICDDKMPHDQAVWVHEDQACLYGTMADIAEDGGVSDPNIKWVIVNSPGGDVKKGLELGREIKRRNLDLIVWDRCSSSCANYLFLGARRKIIPEGTLVMWHGSPYRERDQLIKSMVFGKSTQSVSSLKKTIKFNQSLLKAHTDFYADNPTVYKLVTGSDHTLRTQGSRLVEISEANPGKYLMGWTPSPRRMQDEFGVRGIICELCDFDEAYLRDYYRSRPDLEHYTLEDFTEFPNPDDHAATIARNKSFNVDLDKAHRGDSQAMARVAKAYVSRTHVKYDWALGMMWARLATEFGDSVPLPEPPDWASQYKKSQWIVWEERTRQMAVLWRSGYEAGVFDKKDVSQE